MELASFHLRRQASVGDDVYVFKLSCNSENSVIAAATSEHVIRLFDPSSLMSIRSLEGHGDNVEDVGFFQANPACLVSCSTDKTARLWDIRASEAAVQQFNVGSEEVFSCSVGRCDAALACAASEKVHLFDITAAKPLHVYRDCHTDVVNHVRFHPVDTNKLLTGAEDNLIIVLDTDRPSEDDSMLVVLPNEESVQSFSLVGPTRETLCSASTTHDVRVWGLGANDCGMRKAEFLGVRHHPLLLRDEAPGYFVEMFYDMPSAEVFLLAGCGDTGDMVLFRVTDSGPAPIASFVPPSLGGEGGASGGHKGHTGIVRSALCLPAGVIVTAGEDGCVCAWTEDSSKERFSLQPTSYAAERTASTKARSEPY